MIVGGLPGDLVEYAEAFWESGKSSADPQLRRYQLGPSSLLGVD
jgi:hypothetical protein